MQTLTLPTPTQNISAQYLVSIIDNTMDNLLHGVLHINYPFAEPLYDDTSIDIDWQNSLSNWWKSSRLWLIGSRFCSLALANDWHV